MPRAKPRWAGLGSGCESPPLGGPRHLSVTAGPCRESPWGAPNILGRAWELWWGGGEAKAGTQFCARAPRPQIPQPALPPVLLPQRIPFHSPNTQARNPRLPRPKVPQVLPAHCPGYPPHPAMTSWARPSLDIAQPVPTSSPLFSFYCYFASSMAPQCPQHKALAPWSGTQGHVTSGLISAPSPCPSPPSHHSELLAPFPTASSTLSPPTFAPAARSPGTLS